ncbi:MAG TPA: class I SAM-dependent methyltransferase [Anaerolineae bacterium]
MSETERVARRWDDSEWTHGTPKDFWAYHPIIQAYIHANISPQAADMLDWLKRTFLPGTTVPVALSICCGTGAGDRQALAAGVCSQLEGFDISPRSIEIARQRAGEAGFGGRVHYWVDDANTFTLAENRYDIVLAFGAIHHIEALERVCQQLKRGLKPGSLIFMNEFVGPARFQWTPAQLELINRVMAILPPAWRRANRVEAVPVADVIASDPSEAVRSDKIIDIFCQHFELLDFCDMGGGLLMPLWERGLIPDVFLQSSPADRQVVVKLLILLDELLAEHHIIPSNFAQLVFRHRPPSPGNQQVSRRLSAQSPARKQWTDMWLPGTQFTELTPWWRLPFKAWQILRKEGLSSLTAEVRSYLRWRTSRLNTPSNE